MKYIKLFENFDESFIKDRINEEVLDDLKDDKSIIDWLEKNLEDYFDGLYDYGSGDNIIDKLGKLLVIVGLKLGIDKNFLTEYIVDDNYFLSDDYKTNRNEYGEGSVEGSISMGGIKIIDYTCGDDGYAFSASIDSKNFERAITDFIDNIKNKE